MKSIYWEKFEIENISDFVEYIIPFLMLNFLMRN